MSNDRYPSFLYWILALDDTGISICSEMDISYLIVGMHEVSIATRIQRGEFAHEKFIYALQI